jgi:EAL domain-containing protein (putative c-di-GMP-specific phosphodiesterase class I)
LGVRVAIDDFGRGYSCLSSLRSLPLDTLKIDRTLIHTLSTDERDRRIVEFIINIGRTLDMQVVAEGVEEENQLRLLQAYGCDMIQGYYVSQPVPGAEYKEWLRLRAVQRLH